MLHILSSTMIDLSYLWDVIIVNGIISKFHVLLCMIGFTLMSYINMFVGKFSLTNKDLGAINVFTFHLFTLLKS